MAFAPWEAEEKPPVKSLESGERTHRENSSYITEYLSPQNPNENYSLGKLEKQVQE